MESEEFLLLPVNQLMDIIASDELNVHSEEQVFNAVMAWTRYNVQERRGHLPMVGILNSELTNSHSDLLVSLLDSSSSKTWVWTPISSLSILEADV